MSVQRLDKILAARGSLSRNDVKKIIKNGGVSINGVAVKDCAFKVDLSTDELSVNGETISLKEHIYIMMNKPKGILCVSSDPKERTVIDIVPPELMKKGLFPAGRLDKDTTGFVLITDDGAFAHRLLSPKNHIKKIYIARLAEPLADGAEERFKNGVTLSDGYKCLPAEIQMNGERTVATVTLREGKYHQIKRMFAANGNSVLELNRIMMGDLELDENLQPGQCREILPSEMDKLL